MRVGPAVMLCLSVLCSSCAARPPDVSSWLRARHVEDLPDAQELAAMPGAEGQLWAAYEGPEPAIVKARALVLLGGFPDSGPRLAQVAAQEELHRKLRAAAVQGLGRADLRGDATLRAAVEGQLRSPDVNVARAAVEALRGVPESAEALRTLADDEVVTEAVRRAAR
jgi:hypothetical protein